MFRLIVLMKVSYFTIPGHKFKLGIILDYKDVVSDKATQGGRRKTRKRSGNKRKKTLKRKKKLKFDFDGITLKDAAVDTFINRVVF